MAEQAPVRDIRHDALAVFLGDWKADGTSYGGTDQSGDPKANGVPWTSTHTGRWHTGDFFLLQDERAKLDRAAVFDTLSIMGVDPDTGEYFVRSFENHGFYRHYDLTCDGNRWLLAGATEQAMIEFRDENRTQVISWEWKPGEIWLPLCDRIAVRTD